MGPGNPSDEPFNYIWILYEGSVQPNSTQMEEYEGMFGFDVNKFAADHVLGPAVGMNWFYSAADETVQYIHNELWGGAMAYPQRTVEPFQCAGGAAARDVADADGVAK